MKSHSLSQIDDQLREAVVAMSADVGLRPGEISLQRIEGGRNNKTFRIHSGDRPLLLKKYFTHADDPRDRMAAEFAFCKFAWRHGIHVVPEPLACSPAHRAAIYGFIEGTRPTVEEIDASNIDAAADFIRVLNLHRDAPEAKHLPIASEACFSGNEHFACVERRVDALTTIKIEFDIDRDAAEFVNTQLRPAWIECRRAAETQAAAWSMSLDEEISDDARCVSPSDFGFHNALVDSSGTLHFIDFEYAGWDDPAKLVCDFFCQVEIPVPREYLRSFADRALSPINGAEGHRQRIELLMPVYQLKWCCILLNEFSPHGAARREFGGEADLVSRRSVQLQKAHDALSQLTRPATGVDHASLE